MGPDKVERDGAGGEGETPSDHPRHRVQRLVLVVRGRVAAVGDHRRHVWARGACERAVDFVAPRERGERGSRNSTVRALRKDRASLSKSSRETAKEGSREACLPQSVKGVLAALVGEGGGGSEGLRELVERQMKSCEWSFVKMV